MSDSTRVPQLGQASALRSFSEALTAWSVAPVQPAPRPVRAARRTAPHRATLAGRAQASRASASARSKLGCLRDAESRPTRPRGCRSCGGRSGQGGFIPSELDWALSWTLRALGSCDARHPLRRYRLGTRPPPGAPRRRPRAPQPWIYSPVSPAPSSQGARSRSSHRRSSTGVSGSGWFCIWTPLRPCRAAHTELIADGVWCVDWP